MSRVVHVFALVGLTLAPMARSAETAENPMYSSWAAYPIGTTVVTRMNTTINGKSVPGGDVKTIRLVEKTNEKVILEEVLVSYIGDEQIEGDPERVEYKRAYPPGVKPGKPSRAGQDETGEEEVEVLGTVYPTKWTQTRGQTEAGPSFTKTWVSTKMPGQIVKSVTEVPAVKKNVTIEVVKLVIPAN